jgi:deoxyribodipyrimidine photolyase
MLAPVATATTAALALPATQPKNEPPLASAALQASADDSELVNEMFVNQTATIDLLKRELQARKLHITAKNRDTLVARLAAAIRSAGPDGNVQQCTTAVATETRRSKRRIDADTQEKDAKRQQQIPAEQHPQQNQHQPPQPATSAPAVAQEQAQQQLQAFLQMKQHFARQRTPMFVNVPSGLAPYQQFQFHDPLHGPMITLIVPVSSLWGHSMRHTNRFVTGRCSCRDCT